MQDKYAKLQPYQKEIVTKLPPLPKTNIEQFMINLTVFTQVYQPIEGPTIFFPWQKNTHKSASNNEQSLIRSQCLELMDQAASLVLANKQENSNGFMTPAQSRKQLQIEETKEKTQAYREQQEEQMGMEIGDQNYERRMGKINKSDYKKYFGKGKVKINMNSCCCHFEK